MKSFVSVSVYCFIVLISLVSIHAQEDAQSLHKRLSDQFSSAKTLRVVASSAELRTPQVKITAKRKDMFIVELSDRMIVSDGSSVWNYTPSKKSVVVSKYNTKGSGLSVDKLLLEVISKYKPSSVRNENNSDRGSNYMLRLEPDGQELYGIRSIDLSISKKTLNIVFVSLTTDSGKQEWKVLSVKTNVEVNDSAFIFKAPKGVEVIDLRQ